MAQSALSVWLWQGWRGLPGEVDLLPWFESPPHRSRQTLAYPCCSGKNAENETVFPFVTLTLLLRTGN